MKHLYIFNNLSRGFQYGVGSYMEQLLKYLDKQDQMYITCVNSMSAEIHKTVDMFEDDQELKEQGEGCHCSQQDRNSFCHIIQFILLSICLYTKQLCMAKCSLTRTGTPA